MVALNPPVPKTAWRLLDVTDLCEDESDYGTCELCGKQRIRFAHTMEHVDGRRLTVGCDCAGHLTGDYKAANALRRQSINQARKKKVANG